MVWREKMKRNAKNGDDDNWNEYYDEEWGW